MSDLKRKLSGRTLQVYLYLLKKKLPSGIREIQRDLLLSSPSVAEYQVAKNTLTRIAADRVGMGESSLYSLTFGVAFLDADRDGWRDAFIANGHIDDYIERFDSRVTYAERPLFYQNERGARFVEIGLQAGPAMSQKLVARGCAVADYDQDGDPDLAVTENNRPAHLFRNDTPTGNRFLRVVLHGKRPNRDAIGARVTLTAAGIRQRQLRDSVRPWMLLSTTPSAASSRSATVNDSRPPMSPNAS